MILSDRDISLRLLSGSLQVEPPLSKTRQRSQIQPASLDLRLDTRFRVYGAKDYLECAGRTRGGVVALDGSNANPEMGSVVASPDTGFPLYPGAFALGSTIECITLPDDLVARVEGRSSLGRLGLMIHVTAGFVDPGFTGQITLEFCNVSPNTILLKPGTRICQLSFHQLSSSCERPYGRERGSKYQNQVGPVASRVQLDALGT